jgi:hypothetical protein
MLALLLAASQPTLFVDDKNRKLSPWTESPLVFGTATNVAAAERSVRRCGMSDLHQRRYKNGKALLFMGRRNTPSAIACANRWIAQHHRMFDPLLGAE